MSQGIIVKKGSDKPSKLDVPVGTVKCECGEEFVIYQHRAHPEDAGAHEARVRWLENELKAEHRCEVKHRESYDFPGR
jgi:hypothetical protein